MDENAIGTCAELIFAPIDASFADDAPLLPSGFRIIPLESGKVSFIYCQTNSFVCIHLSTRIFLFIAIQYFVGGFQP